MGQISVHVCVCFKLYFTIDFHPLMFYFGGLHVLLKSLCISNAAMLNRRLTSRIIGKHTFFFLSREYGITIYKSYCFQPLEISQATAFMFERGAH